MRFDEAASILACMVILSWTCHELEGFLDPAGHLFAQPAEVATLFSRTLQLPKSALTAIAVAWKRS